MANNAKITISVAAERYHINPNTLMSWVRKNKVTAEKQLVGRKPVYFVDEDSLIKHLADRSQRTPTPLHEGVVDASPAEAGEDPAPSADEVALNSGAEARGARPANDPDRTVDFTDPLSCNSQEKSVESESTTAAEASERDQASTRPKRPNRVHQLKNNMRNLSVDELHRVNAWIHQRILKKIQSAPPLN